MNNRLNSSILPLVGLSVLLSLSAIIAVAAHWPDRGSTTTIMRAPIARHMASVQNVRVVMHDPGCHWFQTSSGFKTVLAIRGPVNLTNMDEAALKIAGVAATKLDKVGSSLRLGPGSYRITMVGQAPDDNHLKLNVS